MYAVEGHHASLHMSDLKPLCWIATFYWQLLLAEHMCSLISCLVVYLIIERLPVGNLSMSEYRYLGKSNHKVIPSCIVLKIRSHYPKSDEVYLGFKEY